ncbi:MAG: hypothetical protein RL117_1686 [Verrucomicrobiota bacterium]
MGVVDICRRPLINSRTSHAMQFTSIYLLTFLLAMPALCQSAPPKTEATLEQSKENLKLWLETAQKRQSEENAWKSDQEILSNYKEGLLAEKATYQKQIEEAKQRASAASQESTNKINQRDQFIAAEKALSEHLKTMETEFVKQIPTLPAPLLKMPKMATGIETLKKNLSAPNEAENADVGKRTSNLTEMIAEIEKFQQNVTVTNELHKNSSGQEFNMQVVYMGLAIAYAVNDDASFALVGRPSESGWKFSEKNEIAADVKKLILTATTEKDVSLTILPVPAP